MTSDNKETVVRELGQIIRFCPPETWRQVPEEKSETGQRSYSIDFSPPDDSSAVLSVYFRGFLISAASAMRFESLLEEQPHVLSTEEVSALNMVLSKIADEDAFEIRCVQTSEISGRMALVIDGEWKTSHTQFHGLMVPLDESTQEIQEIFFEAPAASFAKYLNEVAECIRAIEWKHFPSSSTAGEKIT